jgi:hypothetical protein
VNLTDRAFFFEGSDLKRKLEKREKKPAKTIPDPTSTSQDQTATYTGEWRKGEEIC